jgi:hypothetical protein
MEIHKPKPVHSWREFLKEYAIVVLGVLTALSLEQAVEKWREHEQYLLQRNAIRSELDSAVSNITRRKEFRACLVQRLDEISALLDRAEAHQSFTPITWVGSPNSFSIRDSDQSNLSQSILIPPDEQMPYRVMYIFLHSIRNDRRNAQRDWRSKDGGRPHPL